MKISVCIPTHDMDRKEFFLRRSLEALWNQTLQDFEIIVSDNSDDDILKEICDYYKTGITYFKNPIKGMAQNTNAAMKAAKGELIKILYLDDYLADEDSLAEIWSNFNKEWLVTGCLHQGDEGEPFGVHNPTYNHEAILSGINTIGSPSVVTLRNKNLIFFDEKMTWLLDCEYYKRMYEQFGEPAIVNGGNVVMGLGQHQATNRLSNKVKLHEQHYLLTKNNG